MIIIIIITIIIMIMTKYNDNNNSDDNNGIKNNDNEKIGKKILMAILAIMITVIMRTAKQRIKHLQMTTNGFRIYTNYLALLNGKTNDNDIRSSGTVVVEVIIVITMIMIIIIAIISIMIINDNNSNEIVMITIKRVMTTVILRRTSWQMHETFMNYTKESKIATNCLDIVYWRLDREKQMQSNINQDSNNIYVNFKVW